MARKIDDISFREMDNKFLLVKDIDMKTRMTIKNMGFKIRQDDNAMLVFAYIDHEAGISFELLCAACVYDDEEVSFEPTDKSTSLKFRYGSFQGNIVPFTKTNLLVPFYEKVQMIVEGYKASDDILEIRAIQELDPSRAPGYPDDIVVFFFKEGYRNEGIWCRIVGSDRTTRLVQMRMLNEPDAPFGRHMGDIVDVRLYQMDDGEVKAAAVL